ncbi:MAG: SHOCT domain-containing protein [Haloferacaceae archaeon]
MSDHSPVRTLLLAAILLFVGFPLLLLILAFATGSTAAIGGGMMGGGMLAFGMPMFGGWLLFVLLVLGGGYLLLSERDGTERTADREGRTTAGSDLARTTARGEVDEDAALATLRERYARGELDEAAFERKVEALLETESPESARERVEDRET